MACPAWQLCPAGQAAHLSSTCSRTQLLGEVVLGQSWLQRSAVYGFGKIHPMLAEQAFVVIYAHVSKLELKAPAGASFPLAENNRVSAVQGYWARADGLRDKDCPRCGGRSPCCSTPFTGTNDMLGRVTASQIAAASPASVLPRLTYALTYFGGISRTVCPSLMISRAQ